MRRVASCPPEGQCPGWLPTEGTQRPCESEGVGVRAGRFLQGKPPRHWQAPRLFREVRREAQPPAPRLLPHSRGGQSRSSPHLIFILTGRGDTVGKTAIKSTFPGSVPGSDCQIPGCLEESTAGCGDSMGSTWRWGTPGPIPSLSGCPRKSNTLSISRPLREHQSFDTQVIRLLKAPAFKAGRPGWS